MLELEPMAGLRVVADPGSLDGAVWRGDGVLVLRTAPDEALAFDAIEVDLDDEHAIVEDEPGFAAAWVTADVIESLVRPHVEWAIPTERPTLVQGSIAGIPGRLWLTEDGALIVVATAYASELQERLR